MTAAEIILQLKNVRRSGKGWSARCPAHQDRQNSLSVAEGRNGKVLLYCFAGCQFKDIVGALNLNAHDLRPASRRFQQVHRKDSRRIVREAVVEEFEAWRNYHIRRLNDKYRLLGEACLRAREVLCRDPENAGAQDAIEIFANAEAELCRALDFLLCTKASEWLERDSTPAEIFEAWRARRAPC
jgi:hypothetical protein